MCSVTITGNQLQSHLSTTDSPFHMIHDVNLNRIDTSNTLSDNNPITFSEINFIGNIMIASNMTESYMTRELHAEVCTNIFHLLFISSIYHF